MRHEGASRRRGEQRRGEELRRHILLVAKEVFLETGYERASMDTVAARAETSKRSLYAHFESKDKLFLAVLDLIRELYLDRLRTPDVYADDPAEAVALFCGRFLQLMVWEPQTRTCRLIITAAERLPGSASAYFDAIFASTRERLTAYLAERFDVDRAAGAELAEDLLGRAVLPRLFRTLLNVEDPVKDEPDEAVLAEHVDLDAIRRLVSVTLPG
ncbi:TetR/AcrR family transcriptional regulator [Goodfellowiella coeruleoviolacea]|uniref:Transcriptional regulator, TetR family n=1 Tax=Goodfellowiella coeruleoviolacea TaxID=334858 RepID=A0AAE3GLE8_9PSEU|nr:TetR/AcrR family transcriptional regulator [Goodfellowiella coeruleoviolacea]MCP2170170.1 transcriptional regulator, TetR family [Goodfellowiella coeruleoviolacea]